MGLKHSNIEGITITNNLNNNENTSILEDQYYSFEYNSKDIEDSLSNNKKHGKSTYKYDEKFINNDITYEELALSVGEKSEDFYLMKWTNMEKKNKIYSWNWSAFMFNYYWFLYRKMYGYGIGLLCISFLLNLLDSYFNINLNLFFMIITGTFANIIYKKHTFNKINKIKSKVLDYEEQRQVLLKKGGSNWIFTFIIAILNFALLLAGIIKIAAMSLHFNL